MGKMEFAAEGRAATALKGLNLGYIHFSGARNVKTSPLVDRIIDETCRKTTEKFRGREISSDPTLHGVREFFRRLGIDPTRYRPSGEALIKRVVGGDGIYRINAVVDINNAVSLISGCPCGVYDAGRFVGSSIKITIGEAGQTYEGIGGKPVNGEGKILTADEAGVFGGPVADSRRTCVTIETSSVLMLIYHPDSASYQVLQEGMEKAAEWMKTVTGAGAEYSGVYKI